MQRLSKIDCGRFESLDIVSKIIDECLVTKCAEFLHNIYLQPKIRPYTARQTIITAFMPSIVRT